MLATCSYDSRSSKAFLHNSSSLFPRLLPCKTTYTKRRRVFVRNFKLTGLRHLKLDQNYGRKEDKPKSLNIYKVSLNKKEQESWLEFLKLDEGNPVVCRMNHELANKGKRLIKLDHPFVPVIGDFAIAAFNELCEMHVKYGESNNVRDHEVMECKYLKFSTGYCFHMVIEAIEEGILSVYETRVACDTSDGRRTLIKFNLTDHRPIGKIAMTLPHLICLKSKYKIMKGMKNDLKIKLETSDKFMTGENKRKAAAVLVRQKEQHKAMKGICNVLYHQIWSQIPRTWNERSNPGDWSVPSYRTSGLQNRSKNSICKGYDYQIQAGDFSFFTRW